MNRPAPVSRTLGFTLLELLVVLVIMAVAVGGAVLSMRTGESHRLSGEAGRLALLLDLAREESRIGGASLAWISSPGGYAFLRRELTAAGPAWQILGTDEMLRPRTFSAGLEVVRIVADGLPVGPGGHVDLGPLGARQVVIDLALGAARTRIAGDDDRFAVLPLPEDAS